MTPIGKKWSHIHLIGIYMQIGSRVISFGRHITTINNNCF